MQQSLFPDTENVAENIAENASEKIALPGGNAMVLFRSWLPTLEADDRFSTLLNEAPWQQPLIKIAGKEHPIPRRQVWYGEKGAAFTYSGRRFEPVEFTQSVFEIKRAVEQACSASFNSVLMNHYRHESDSVGWHADDEPEFGPEPSIASLSLGATRRFQFKPKPHYYAQAGWEKRKRSLVFELRHGDLLLMNGGVQSNWLHAVPKEKHRCEPRLNLTFRKVVLP